MKKSFNNLLFKLIFWLIPRAFENPMFRVCTLLDPSLNSHFLYLCTYLEALILCHFPSSILDWLQITPPSPLPKLNLKCRKPFSRPKRRKSDAGLISSPPVHSKSPVGASTFTRKLKVFVFPIMLKRRKKERGMQFDEKS